ncbi:MAG: ABC transporter permease [Dehalococcoidia bacterium]|nr:ABC transporter permease [Dehalococcoidia bacterium]
MTAWRTPERTDQSETTGRDHPFPTVTNAETLARRGGFFRDTLSVAERALRSVRRDPEVTVPALFIPVFMYIVTVGALNDIAEGIPGLNYRAFQIPVAVLFAVTGISRAMVVVTDIQTGYFDRLAISPVNRLALLLGLMIADFAMVVALSVPVVIMAFIAGVNFATGVPGILVFMFLSGLWGLIFAGFPFAISLKTGNPAAVNISFLLFFPLLFTTTLFMPQEAMTGWLSAAADYNPVTYLLAALRSLISDGWEPLTLAKGLGAILAVGVLSIGLALAALKGRATRR